jgi:hypothetical protein
MLCNKFRHFKIPARLIAIVSTVALIAIVFFLGVVQFLKVANYTNQTNCAGKCAAIRALLDQYKVLHGEYPAPVYYDVNGLPMHSWRMLLARSFLPEIYGDYRLDEAWDSPANQRFLKDIPVFFKCDNDTQASEKFHTSYVMVVNSFTTDLANNSMQVAKRSKVAGGLVLVAEIAESGIPWTKPEDIDIATMSFDINDYARPSIRSKDQFGPIIILKNLQAWRINPYVAELQPTILFNLLAGDDSLEIELLVQDNYLVKTN